MIFEPQNALAYGKLPGLSRGMVLRVALALALLWLAAFPVLAVEGPSLRGDITAKADILTFGDLVADAPPAIAGTPVFRAPALGENGTIQTARIVDAAITLGLPGLETGGRAHVTVSRAARRIGAVEIEAALKRAIEQRHQIDARALSLVFDGASPSFAVAPDNTMPVSALDVVYDPRSRRVAGTVYVGPSPSERLGQTRVSGVVVEMVEVAVLTRAIERGEAVRSTDVVVERRVRESVPADARFDGVEFDGRVAKRALAAGAPVRQNDLIRPDLVARGEAVSIVYEAPGLVLTLRGKANEAGAKGDVISVTNPQSKKVLQATVVSPGRVTVSGPLPGPVASASGVRQ